MKLAGAAKHDANVDWTSAPTQSIGLSSVAVLRRRCPDRASPAGLWVVGQQLGCPHEGDPR